MVLFNIHLIIQSHYLKCWTDIKMLNRQVFLSLSSSCNNNKIKDVEHVPITGSICLHTSKKCCDRISPCSDFTCFIPSNAGAKTVPSIFEFCCTWHGRNSMNIQLKVYQTKSTWSDPYLILHRFMMHSFLLFRW